MCVIHEKKEEKVLVSNILFLYSPFLSIKVKRRFDVGSQVNKTLRSQSVDLIQENMRLKAEVANRSPQK